MSTDSGAVIGCVIPLEKEEVEPGASRDGDDGVVALESPAISKTFKIV